MLLILLMLLDCTKPLFRNERAKFAPSLEDAKNFLEAVGLDDLLGDSSYLLTLPVKILIHKAKREIEKYYEEYKSNKEFNKFLKAIDSGNDKDAEGFLEDTNLLKSISSKRGMITHIIHLVIQKGMRSTLSKIIDKIPNWHIRDKKDPIPLIEAIKKGDHNMFETLLNGIKIRYAAKKIGNSNDEEGTNTTYSLERRDFELVCNLEEEDVTGFTALHWAILSFGDTHFLDILLNLGVKIDKTLGVELNELHFASLAGNFEAVERIVRNYSKNHTEKEKKKRILEATSKYKRTAFHFAAVSGSKDIYEYLSRQIYSEAENKIPLPVDKYCATPLHYLSLKNILDPLIRYEEEKVKRSRDGSPSMLIGEEILEQENKEYSDKKIGEKIELFKYIIRDDKKLILENDENVSYENRPFLNNLGTANKASAIFQRTTDGLTMLHYASYFGNFDLFKVVIEKIKTISQRGSPDYEFLSSLKHLETEEKADESKKVINKASVISLSYKFAKEGVFDFIVKELAEIFEITLELIEKGNLTGYRADRLRFRIEKSQMPNEALLNLFMLIIGYKTENNSDERKLWIQSREEGSFWKKLDEDGFKEDTKLFLKGSSVGKLLDFEDVSVFEEEITDLEEEKKFFIGDQDLNVSEPSEIARYFFAAIYMPNPYSAINKLICKLEKKQKDFNCKEGLNFCCNFEDESSRVIDIVVKKNLYRLTRFLLEHGANVLFKDEDNLMHLAAKLGLAEISGLLYGKAVKSPLVSEYENIGRDGRKRWPINYAIKGYMDEMHKDSPDLKKKGKYLRCIEEIVEAIQDNIMFSSELDENTDDLKDIAIESCSAVLLKYIFNTNNENFNKINILCESIEKRKEESCKYILSRYPEIMETDLKDRKSLLHLALSNNCFGFALDLLKKGANPNIKDKKGYTPIFRMLENIGFLYQKDNSMTEDELKTMKKQIRQILSNKDIDINEKLKKKDSLLDLAIERGLSNEVIALLNRGDIVRFISNIKTKSKRKKLIESAIAINDYATVEKIITVYKKTKKIEMFSDIKEYGPLLKAAVEGKEGKAYDESFIALLSEVGYSDKYDISSSLEFLIYISVKYCKEGSEKDRQAKLEYLKNLTYTVRSKDERSIEEVLESKIGSFCKGGENKTLSKYLEEEDKEENKILKEYKQKFRITFPTSGN